MTSWLNKSLFLITLCLLPAGIALAEGYVELVGVPGLVGADEITTNQYINALYTLSIGIAALLAVVKLILAGAKYILSDVVTTKESAKKDIYTAILGLLIVLSAVLILQTINRDLTNFDILSTLQPVTTTIPTYVPPSPPPTCGDTVNPGEYGCVRAACPTNRSEDTCEEWCSTFDQGVLDTNNVCTYQRGAEDTNNSPTSVAECRDKGWIWNENSAICIDPENALTLPLPDWATGLDDDAKNEVCSLEEPGYIHDGNGNCIPG